MMAPQPLQVWRIFSPSVVAGREKTVRLWQRGQIPSLPTKRFGIFKTALQTGQTMEILFSAMPQVRLCNFL